MNAMKGFFSAPQMEDPSGMYMMDMDMDHDDAVAIMAAMQESEGPQVKMVDLDFFNDFGDDFDDDDLN
ncbi:uncharacterized protein ACA1_164970 [Acanthamoeba castellanii str. Neff]|uniref:Small acidic protein 1 n=1 Tax=Acanthamoeba castellanii (strain ATCC 30010 / Neff) TaxID=1257118 RepID=L8GRN4_ACACF|nr:uncharacterized protein ACA1_164970 [Acanthamoeba castellanii str. Neff]ELR15615.1 hypothetical protein ACA1_164970 [Acanthamoeba castellanii str. Neff]